MFSELNYIKSFLDFYEEAIEEMYNKRCYNCNLVGHLSVNCRNIPQRKERCVGCDKVGGHHEFCSQQQQLTTRVAQPIFGFRIYNATLVQMQDPSGDYMVDQTGLEHGVIRMTFNNEILRFYGQIQAPVSFQLQLSPCAKPINIIWKPSQIVVADFIISDKAYGYEYQGKENLKTAFVITAYSGDNDRALVYYKDKRFGLSVKNNVCIVLPKEKFGYLGASHKSGIERQDTNRKQENVYRNMVNEPMVKENVHLNIDNEPIVQENVHMDIENDPIVQENVRTHDDREKTVEGNAQFVIVGDENVPLRRDGEQKQPEIPMTAEEQQTLDNIVLGDDNGENVDQKTADTRRDAADASSNFDEEQSLKEDEGEKDDGKEIQFIEIWLPN